MKRRVASLLGALVLLTSAVMMAGCPQSAKPDIQKYKVTLKAGEHGTIAANPVLPKDGMVAQYAKLTFTATPDEGYELAGWTGAAPDNADIHKATLTVAADATITATFKKKPEIKKYKITLNQGEHGTVTVDPVLPKDGMVEQYTTLTFTATPENGYEVEWTGAAPSSADKNKATLTVTADASVTPVFKKTGNSTPEIKKYKITLNQGEHGAVTVEPPLPADGMVEQYKTLTFTATPDNNYKLAEWVGAAPTSADKNKATLTVTADATITVKFKQKEAQRYHVVLNKGEHGTVTVDPALPADGMVEQKEMLTFTAVPDAGYEVEWSGAAPSSADKNKATLTVTADATVTATFKLKLPNGFHVALSSGAHGSVQAVSALPANGMVAKDTVLTFTATPDAGYEVDKWTGATQDSADNNKATLKVTAHITVSVTFKEKIVDPSLLQIDSDGTLSRVTDRNALAGRLEIPATVTKIGDNAFEGCSKLTSVTMADNVTEIENNAFKGCSKLTNVTIGSGVTDIKNWAFGNCTRLTSITINSRSLNGIGWGAFENCTELTSLTIGKSVANINFISKLPKINTVTVDPENPTYCSVDNIIYTKDKTKLIFAAPGLTGEITIPDSVTEIDSTAFSGCRELTGITIGKNLTALDSHTFDSCQKLSSITVNPDNATYCSLDNIIYNKEKTKLIFAAPGLTGEITIPDSVTEIDRAAFSGCRELTGITIGKNLTTLDSHTFDSCQKLSSITVNPDNATYCSLDNIVYTNDKKYIVLVPQGLTGAVTIPDSVIEIRENAFSIRSGITAVTIGARVTKIGEGAFSSCFALSTVTIGAEVTEIGRWGFSKCPELSTVTLGNRVTKIGEGAFTGCYKLTDITIPDSVTEIGIEAFGYCDKLTSAGFKAPSGWKVLSKDGNTTENINQADLEDTSKAATYLRDTYREYTWQKQ